MTATHPALQPEADISRRAAPPEEHVHDNALWLTGSSGRLTIAIPSYRDDAVPMIEALSKCDRFEEVEVVLFDDGAKDPQLLHRFNDYANGVSCPMRVVSALANAGRSAARNRLIFHARSKWLLLLDADMLPDDANFLSIYLDEIANAPAPGLFVGGFSLKQAPQDAKYALHRWQSARSECLTAAQRNVDPGRFVYTSNVLAHRQILTDIGFDESFTGWGWEDVDWGLRVAKKAPVRHLDNPATHMGLDTDDKLMAKYARSGPNFARALERHPSHLNPSPLGRHSRNLKKLPKPLRDVTRIAAKKLAQSTILPLKLRGMGLMLWRALIYAEAVS